MVNKDIYFKRGSFLTKSESIENFIESCITVDFYGLRHFGKMAICVGNKEIIVDRVDMFRERVQEHLNAHYYEYIIFMNKYLNNISEKCNKK